MPYFLSRIPDNNIMEIINKYRPQIEENLTSLELAFTNDKEVCLRWGIIFYRLEVDADIRVGKLIQNDKETENRVWIVIYDELGQGIIFDPCSRDPNIDALETAYFVEKIYKLSDLGSGDARLDFMQLLKNSPRYFS